MLAVKISRSLTAMFRCRLTHIPLSAQNVSNKKSFSKTNQLLFGRCGAMTARLFTRSFENDSSSHDLKPTSSDKPQEDSEHEDEEEFKNDPELKTILKNVKNDVEHENQTSTTQDDSHMQNSQSPQKSDVTDKLASPDESDTFMVDVDRELQKYNIEEFYTSAQEFEEDEDPDEEQEEVVYTRGVQGVFDVEDLCEYLRSEQLNDICVIAVSPEVKYVDYMVIASGRSTRHILAAAERVKKLWKLKRKSGDPNTARIEGLGSSDWMALDLGNIALHLFLPETRKYYDLETLWTCGSEYDQATLQEENKYGLTLTSNMDLEEAARLLFQQSTDSINTSFETTDEDCDKEEVDNTPRYNIPVQKHQGKPRGVSAVVYGKYMTSGRNKKSLENVAGWHDQDK